MELEVPTKMNGCNNVPIRFFLKERKDRYSPEQANLLGLRRLEKIDFSGQIHFADSRNTHTNMILVRKGDLVISGINVEKGAISVYNGEKDVLATIHYSSYSFDEDQIDIGYFKWFLKSRIFKDVINLNIRGGIKTELKPKHFLSLIIPLPTLKAQILIRTKLDSVVGEIEELKKLNYENEGYIRKLRQAILLEAICGKLVPQSPNEEPASELLKKLEVEKEKLIRERKIKKEKKLSPISKEKMPFDQPKGWEWVRLNELGYFMGGGTPSTNKPEFWKGDNLWISPKDMKSDSISDSELKISNEALAKSTAKLIPEGSVLIVARSGILKRTLPVCISAKECTVNQDIKVLVPYIKEMNRYIQIMLKGCEAFILTNLVKRGMTVQSLEYDKFENQSFLLPPFAEQQRIVGKVEHLMDLFDELEKKVKENQNNSEILMEAVLKEAFVS